MYSLSSFLKGFGFSHYIFKNLLLLYLFFYQLHSSSFSGGFQVEVVVVHNWFHWLGSLLCCQGVTKVLGMVLQVTKEYSSEMLLLGLGRWLSDWEHGLL